MKVLDSGGRPERGCAITIGAFDGVHVGHQALIRQVRDRADALGCASAIVTFDRHPASIVRPESAPKLLTDLDQKLELLAATGVDYTLVITFDIDRAAERAEDFVNSTLIERLNARSVVIGHDFHFGKARAGNAALLTEMGSALGFEVIEIPPVAEGEITVSSTAVRKLVGDGDVAGAQRLLGRPHEARGLVVMGDGRGREMGYPTANVNVAPEILLPDNGVYAGSYVFPDGTVRTAAISVGTRPTFYDSGARLLEANVLDFSGDLYGQHAQVRFEHRIRGQERFDSMDDLIVQMDADIDEVRRLVAS